MKRILIILVWFGRLKNYNDFWLKSIEKNPSVDFLLVTDQNNILPPPEFENC